MNVLLSVFGVCKIFGLWYTDHDYFFIKVSWRFLILLILGVFNLSQIIELIILRRNLDEMLEILFGAMTYTGLILKLFNFVLRHDEMCEILEDFRSPACQPMTQEEEKIIQNQSDNVKNMYLFMMVLSLSSGSAMLISALQSFLHNEFRLPFKVYNPYDISIPKYYLIAYSLQFTAMNIGIILNVTMDAMAYAFIMLITCQYEIIGSRYANSKTSIKDCIEHQILLQKINVKIQDFFIKVIVLLFFFSLITLCTIILQMSQINMVSLQFLSVLLYLGCMLSEVFLYCWYGNELVLKSQDMADKIYASNWLDYESQERKKLWFAMLSVQKGVHISYYGQCRLCLPTFIWVIKTSYAAFNVLKQA